MVRFGPLTGSTHSVGADCYACVNPLLRSSSTQAHSRQCTSLGPEQYTSHDIDVCTGNTRLKVSFLELPAPLSSVWLMA